MLSTAHHVPVVLLQLLWTGILAIVIVVYPRSIQMYVSHGGGECRKVIKFHNRSVHMCVSAHAIYKAYMQGMYVPIKHICWKMSRSNFDASIYTALLSSKLTTAACTCQPLSCTQPACNSSHRRILFLPITYSKQCVTIFAMARAV